MYKQLHKLRENLTNMGLELRLDSIHGQEYFRTFKAVRPVKIDNCLYSPVRAFLSLSYGPLIVMTREQRDMEGVWQTGYALWGGKNTAKIFTNPGNVMDEYDHTIDNAIEYGKKFFEYLKPTAVKIVKTLEKDKAPLIIKEPAIKFPVHALTQQESWDVSKR